MPERGTIIVYHLPTGLPAARRVRFQENVWGQTRTARGYTIRRHGALERVPLWKVGRGVVVVRADDTARVVRELKKWKAEVRCWSIQLEAEQARRLRSAIT